MALELIASCPHDVSEQDVASQADGLCPLCLAAEVNRLSIALERVRDFPYVGRQAAQQMALIAGEALAQSNGERK
ncbi:hypothetical protein ABIF96_005824 [Bradyrhizobium ottawaense]|uniref:hypothetical protein n=1 Tax=Bradyrhizobium ottawaense TaxID=931866 RepID=UPI003834942E